MMVQGTGEVVYRSHGDALKAIEEYHGTTCLLVDWHEEPRVTALPPARFG